MPVIHRAWRPTQRPLRIALAIALGWSPAVRAQSAAPPQEPCIKVYLSADGQGKGLLSLAGRAVGGEGEGRVLVEVQGSCAAELGKKADTPGIGKETEASRADRYAEAKEAVARIMDEAKDKGVNPEAVAMVKKRLEDDIDDAKRGGGQPEDVANGRNDERNDEGQKSDDANVAALAALGVACMVASAGICAAAVAAILPSLLPGSTSTEETKGIAKRLNDFNQGKPLSAADVTYFRRVLEKRGKDLGANAGQLFTALREGTGPPDSSIGVTGGITPDKWVELTKFFSRTLRTRQFNCDDLAKITGPAMPVKGVEIADRIVAPIANAKDAGPYVEAIRQCLKAHIVVQ